MTRKLSTEQFVQKSRNIHGNKYDYTDSVYDGAFAPVRIKCNIHGDFYQVAGKHTAGHGCPACGGNARFTTKSFVDKANIIHSNKYDYSEVLYTGIHKDINIICLDHGIFTQLPSSHLSGYGCRKCAGNFKISTEDFIERLRNVHGTTYNYANVIYAGAHTAINITCYTHGEFSQQAGAHLRGQRCPKCAITTSLREIVWLDSLCIPKKYRQHRLIVANKLIIADAYIPETNTIYEYLGDFWHGNPKIFNSDDINPVKGVTFGELYRQTISKKELLIDNGYNVIEKWETE